MSSSGDFHSNENHRLLAKSLFPPPTKKRISIWNQRTENQKYAIEENVMSEQVKMPIRHFLRRDYLHFSLLVFVYFILESTALAALIPEAPACASPLVVPAPSPIAKNPGSFVSSSWLNSKREE